MKGNPLEPTARIRSLLEDLTQSARLERLELAVPLIDAMRISFALDRAVNGAPDGVLTVQGWIGLMNRWDRALLDIPKRRVHYVHGFFQDFFAKSEAEESPLQPMLRELVDTIGRYLASDSLAAA